MARGRPALWTAVMAVPFFVGGLYAYSSSPYAPGTAGLAWSAFAIVIGLLGGYVEFRAPPEPTLTEDEEQIAVRYPAQRVALVTVVASAPFLGTAFYYLFFTDQPYVYPTVPLVIGLGLFSRGLYRYWSNALTGFYITDQRVVRSFEFLSKITKEIPLDQIRGIQENRSIRESLVGLGNVRVASGAGGNTLEVVVRDIHDASEFASQLRELV